MNDSALAWILEDMVWHATFGTLVLMFLYGNMSVKERVVSNCNENILWLHIFMDSVTEVDSFQSNVSHKWK